MYKYDNNWWVHDVQNSYERRYTETVKTVLNETQGPELLRRNSETKR
jgi:hypothetical protein